MLGAQNTVGAYCQAYFTERGKVCAGDRKWVALVTKGTHMSEAVAAVGGLAWIIYVFTI